jgi:hypothetical protein
MLIKNLLVMMTCSSAGHVVVCMLYVAYSSLHQLLGVFSYILLIDYTTEHRTTTVEMKVMNSGCEQSSSCQPQLGRTRLMRSLMANSNSV